MKKLLLSLFISLGFACMGLPYAMACEKDCDPANCPHHAEGKACPQGHKCEGKAHLQGHKCEGKAHSDGHKCKSEAHGKALDPICGTVIDKAHAADQAVYKGETYYFCMKEEKEAFLENPEKYLETDQE